MNTQASIPLSREPPTLPPSADATVAAERRRGRGAGVNPSGRFEPLSRSVFDDGWGVEESLPPFATEVQEETARSVITRNDSPDIGFDRSINPYRGCEHGCVYCYARPTHAYMGLSPGLDFESRLFAKSNAAEVLEREGNYVLPTIISGLPANADVIMRETFAPILYVIKIKDLDVSRGF